jgi:polyferredoxin
MALLFKRAFCSWVCPIGLALEALAFAGGEVLKRKVRLPKMLDILFRAPKYALLGFFVWVICFKMDALQIQGFLDSPYHRIADIKMLEFFEYPSKVTLWVLGALILLGFLIPYSLCRYLCPYGALLGLISLLSPFKITRDEGLCTGCKRCTKACPASMTIHNKKTVRSAECYACLECVGACPKKGALLFQAISKRLTLPLKACAFLVVLLVLLGVLSARLMGVWQSAIPLADYLQHIQRLNEPTYAHPGPTATKEPRVLVPELVRDR